MDQKLRFVELMCRSGMLKFGSFLTKAGRNSPYFINAGEIFRSDHIQEMGEIYADALISSMPTLSNHLFGPAYKGIPLVNITAFALSLKGFGEFTVSYNRKEKKDHGEGGTVVGYPFSRGDKVIIIEDVLSRGTSVCESIELLKSLDVKVVGLLIGVDRMEQGYSQKLASDEIRENYGIQVESIMTLDEIIDTLSHSSNVPEKYRLNSQMKMEVEKYRKTWGS